jgi:alpha-amylase
MAVGPERKGQEWRDATGGIKETVKIEDDGFANFRCLGGSVSVWIPK